MIAAFSGATRPYQGARGVAQAAMLLVGVAILTASAKAQVPFWPVPMTLQTLAVLGLGVVYGPRTAAATVVAYLALGAAGAPVFAAGGGLAYLVGPTAGFLLGLPVAAFTVGTLLAKRPRLSLAGAFAVLFVGDAIIFGCGLAWLAHLFGAGKAIALGLEPFAAAELLKLALGATVIRAAPRMRRA